MSWKVADITLLPEDRERLKLPQIIRFYSVLTACYEIGLPVPCPAVIADNTVCVMCGDHTGVTDCAIEGRYWWCVTLTPEMQQPNAVLLDFGEGLDVQETWAGPYTRESLSKLTYLGKEWLQAGLAGLRGTSMPAGWRKTYPSLYPQGD